LGSKQGQISLGQLARERFGEEAILIGFGTNNGTVIAATNWNDPPALKQLKPAIKGSFDNLLHRSGVGDFLVDFRKADRELMHALSQPRSERMIGAIYRPNAERRGHYAICKPARQFDAFVWFDETRAISRPQRRAMGPTTGISRAVR